MVRVTDETALDRIEVHGVEFFPPLFVAPDVEVVEAALPEGGVRRRSVFPEAEL